MPFDIPAAQNAAGQQKLIVVGMADLNIGKDSQVITTYGLGSCVGITLYDRAHKIGGMAHIMLPTANTAAGAKNIAKFADTAIPDLIEKMVRAGASKSMFSAKIAGGAHMFDNSRTDDVIKVGQRNVYMSQKILQQLGIKLLANETGGTFGRTVELHCDTGDLHIKTIGHGVKIV